LPVRLLAKREDLTVLPLAPGPVARQTDTGRRQCRHRREGRPGGPARHAEADRTGAVAVHDDEVERRLHDVTAPTGATGGGAVIRHAPSCTAPSSMTTTGAAMSPVTRAVFFSSTRSLAVTSPTTSPRTTTVVAFTVACTTPCSPIRSVSCALSSPRRRASSITVPVHTYRPSISEPSSRNAPTRALRDFFFRLPHTAHLTEARIDR